VKLVAVSQRVDVYPDRNETRDALDQRLAAFLLVAGFLPVPTPNTLASRGAIDAWLEAIGPCALVISGGNNIGACGERDQTEIRLLDYAQRNDVPVLGICRGMQMMAVWAGAGLKAVTGHVRTRHQLEGKITGDVNSYHDLALTERPPRFDVLATSNDGEIEAIRHQDLSWEGWMWHPEREAVFACRDLERLKTLFQSRNP